MYTDNLLFETLRYLRFNKKESKYVKWIGINDKYFSWEEFEKLANFNYEWTHEISQLPKINMDLIVVGENWWMERTNNNHFEGWRFVNIPQKPENFEIPKTLER